MKSNHLKQEPEGLFVVEVGVVCTGPKPERINFSIL